MALVFGGLNIPAAGALNSVAAPRPLSAAGARALVPLVYGSDRLNGLVLNVLLANTGSGTLLVQVLWCHACSAVGTLRLNDKALSSGTSVTSYTGSQSTAHAALVTAFAAQGITYSDTLAGYAYSVFSMPVSEFDGELSFSALIDGRLLYDPRKDTTAGGSGSHRLATPSTWEFSSNPSLALADFLYSNTYGANQAVAWSSVITAANANDALIGSPTETHRKIGVSFTSAAAVPDVAEALRAYAGCWLVPTSGGIKLLPDATGASVATYAHDSGQIAAIGPLQLRDLGNSPTAVEVVYTDANQIPYRDASAFAQRSGAGTTLPWRLSTVRLPGVQRYGQAVREATERLNKLYLADLSTTLEVFDGGIAHEVGDIVTVSHPVGLVSKLFRLSAPPQMVGPGRWQLPLAEYDPAVYSTAVATGPTYSDAGRVIDGPDRMFKILTLGYSAYLSGTSYPGYPSPAAGVYDAVTGTAVHGVSYPYTVGKINRATGAYTQVGTYDTLNGVSHGSVAASCAAMAAALNAIGSDYIVVVFTWDEPQGNRLSNGLDVAMYRCGASKAVFGSSSFAYRGAYILIGVAGCGEGQGFERYAGAGSSDVNAWVEAAVQVVGGMMICSGGGRTLTFGTSQLEPNAATDTYLDYYDYTVTVQPHGQIRSFSITPAFDCVVEASAMLNAKYLDTETYNSYAEWTVTPSGGSESSLFKLQGSNYGAYSDCPGNTSFNATGGVALTFKMYSRKYAAGGTPQWRQSFFRLAFVKR